MECIYNRRVNVSDSGWAVNVEAQTDMITTDIAEDVITPISDIFDLGLADDDGPSDSEAGINIGEEVKFRLESNFIQFYLKTPIF